MKKTPYVGYGNDTLRKLRKVYEGDEIDCLNCGKKHKLECAKENGVKTDLLMFYKRGKDYYLGAIGGKLTVGQLPDVKGKL